MGKGSGGVLVCSVSSCWVKLASCWLYSFSRRAMARLLCVMVDASKTPAVTAESSKKLDITDQ